MGQGQLPDHQAQRDSAHKPVWLRIFFSIQEDIEPHSTRISREFLLKCRSQAFSSWGRNNSSPRAIQEISSSRMSTPSRDVSRASNRNSSPQSPLSNRGRLHCSARSLANSARCSAAPMPSRGARPANSRNRGNSRPNSRARRLLPIRLRGSRRREPMAFPGSSCPSGR